MLAARLAPGDAVRQPLTSGRAYLVSTAAAVSVNGTRLEPRDGCRIEGEAELEILASGATEVVLVEVI